jgi:3-dehydroquinate synthase
MRTVQVELAHRSYDILIGSGILEQVPEYLTVRGATRRLFLLANTRVFRLYGEALLQRLQRTGFDATQILIPDGEKYKNLQTVENIYTYLIAQGADRCSSMLALGGGVTGDIGGFVAATFHRGIPYVQIPTTLLAQVDSSVGGKTGVNHSMGKNLIGAFYQPNLVCIDLDTLQSLPPRDFQSGLYEVLKYGLIVDREFFEYFECNVEVIKQRVPEVMEKVIGRCCELKAEVTSADEREKDLRRILNFGHTFGHALEAAGRYEDLLHGEAVGYGIIAAVLLSKEKGNINEATANRVIDCVYRIGVLPRIDHFSQEVILQSMSRDKKRQGDLLHFVLLKDIGKTEIRSDIHQEAITSIWQQIALERHV